MYQITLGFRSLFYRKRQYFSLFLVCMVGMIISLSSIYIATGMIKSLNTKAKIYYGGDLVFMRSFEKDLSITDYEQYEEEFRHIFAKDAVISSRFDYDARRTSVYYEGTEGFFQTIKGIDFQKEYDLFSRFNFVDGGISDFAKGENGVLISEQMAKTLGARVGDELTFMLMGDTSSMDMMTTTYAELKKYINTAQIIVKGIFKDSSVFGMYTAYMDFTYLKQLDGRNENFANRICINFPDREPSTFEVFRYQKLLAKKYTMFPVVTDKDRFIKLQPLFTEPTCALIPLSANLKDVKTMEKAMNAIISFVIIVLTLIIIVGIGSTYRVLIMKRINEIGIYMAIGMKKSSIAATLLFESLFLLILGCIAGFLLSQVLCAVLSLVDFSFIPSFDIFLEDGNLNPAVDVIKSIAVISSVVIATLFAVLYSTLKSIKIMPVQALAVTE